MTEMHLFLDTNIYLGVYKLSGDDLEELRKLAVTVRAGDTVLYLTGQGEDEFRRNRAGIIAESLKTVETAPVPKAYPQLMRNLDGFAQLRETFTTFERQRADLLQEARAGALRQELQADGLVQELFGIAKHIPETEEISRAAHDRHLRGNPPGKKDSIGDALNWECLLVAVPDGEDLVLVTADKDYISKLDGTTLDAFLVEEWRDRKGSTITVHESLTALFKAHYPNIRLAADLERNLAIEELITSGNFRSTHLAIQRLSAFADFTPEEAQTLVEAANSNSQIRQILEDPDVRTFYSAVVERFRDGLPPADLANLLTAMQGPAAGATIDED